MSRGAVPAVSGIRRVCSRYPRDINRRPEPRLAAHGDTPEPRRQEEYEGCSSHGGGLAITRSRSTLVSPFRAEGRRDNQGEEARKSAARKRKKRRPRDGGLNAKPYPAPDSLGTEASHTDTRHQSRHELPRPAPVTTSEGQGADQYDPHDPCCRCCCCIPCITSHTRSPDSRSATITLRCCG